MQVGPNIITNGLVLALDAADKNSYPGSGTTWTDLSGLSNIGANTSLVTYDANKFTASTLNQYIWFGGSNSSLTNLTNDGNNFTFECWFSPLGAVPGTDDGYILGRKGNHSGFRQLKSDATGKSIGSGILWYSDNTTVGVGSTISLNVVGTWAHLTLVVDDQNSLAYAYYNGSPNGSSVSLSKALRSYSTADYFILSGGGNNFSCNGSVATARIYNKALSATEVLQNYNVSKTRFGL